MTEKKINKKRQLMNQIPELMDIIKNLDDDCIESMNIQLDFKDGNSFNFDVYHTKDEIISNTQAILLDRLNILEKELSELL